MRTAKFYVAALIAVSLGVLGQNASAQQEGQLTLKEGQTSPSCISNFKFSEEFLTRYPEAGAACREVKVQNGQKWARFDADVVGVQNNQLTANFTDRFDKSVGTITFSTPPDMRVMVDGQSTSVGRLRRGDKLTFWVPEDRAGFYAEPKALETSKLAVVENTPAQR